MKLLKILWSAFFYIVLFPVTMFLIVLGPIFTFFDLIDIYKLEAPRLGLGLGIIWVLGVILFMSMKFPSLNWLYRKFPVLLPFFQMCYISYFALEVGLTFGNLWADKMLYGKGVAIVLSILAFAAGRAFLSYWYYKYPITYKAVR